MSETEKQDILEKAITIAVEAHKGQVDKGGQPYILHPMRVMLGCKSLDEKIVAILHDVVEDCDLTFVCLSQKGIPPKYIDTLRLLTKENGAPYENYIVRIGENKLATIVKLSDLKDNSDLGRLPSVEKEDADRLAKYNRATAYLLKQLSKTLTE